MTAIDPKMIALHKHWLHADSIKVRISAEVLKPGEAAEKLPQSLLVLGKTHSMFLALSVWYALLYVVIEGYQKMGLCDEGVDAVLAQEEYVDVLRRFRNGIFHYQQNPIPEKVLGFLAMEQSENWIRDLNSAFDAFFCAYPPIKRYLGELGLERKSEAAGAERRSL